MCPRDFQWSETEYRGAVIPLVREVGRPDVAHVAVHFDDGRRILWVGIWWAPGTPEYERPAILARCAEALRGWKGLRGYEARVVTSRRPYPSRTSVEGSRPQGLRR
jgi:hypothetical protein